MAVILPATELWNLTPSSTALVSVSVRIPGTVVAVKRLAVMLPAALTVSETVAGAAEVRPRASLIV
jgi:hypothetical protein